MVWGKTTGQIAATAGAIYTVPSGKISKVKSILLFNSNTTTETIKIYAVPNSGGSLGTASEANQCFSISLSSGNTFEISLGFPLEGFAANDTIQAESTTASKINYWVEAVEEAV